MEHEPSPRVVASLKRLRALARANVAAFWAEAIAACSSVALQEWKRPDGSSPRRAAELSDEHLIRLD